MLILSNSTDEEKTVMVDSECKLGTASGRGVA